MKILMINNLATMHGGAEAMVAHLKAGLEKEGHEVRILCGSEKGNGKNIADAKFLTFEEESKILRLMYVYNPFALSALKKELKDFHPDIVHLHTTSKASPFILKPLKNYPTILTIHDHSLFDPTRLEDLPLMEPHRKIFSDYFIHKPSVRFYLEKLRFFLYRRWAKNADTVFACSDFYAQCARDSGIFHNIHTLHNGIFLPSLSPIENSKNILFAGRLSKEKGILVLLDAMALVKDKHPDARLRIVGGGKQLKNIERKIAELKLDDTVQLLGYKSTQEIYELYRQSALVVVPSTGPDNLPTVCIEAMSIGRPIVASKTGGLPELVDHKKTGLLVAPGDASALADSINQLLSNPELRKKMGEAGRKKAECEFEKNVYVKRTLEEYNILQNKNTNPITIGVEQLLQEPEFSHKEGEV